MSFNFGKTAFKFPPPKDFIALHKASGEDVKDSKIVGGGPTTSKPASNAPQAIIIEPSRELAEQVGNCYKSVKEIKLIRTISYQSLKSFNGFYVVVRFMENITSHHGSHVIRGYLLSETALL